MGSKRHFSQGGRHTSDKQRRDDHLLRRDTKAKYNTTVQDRPLPLIDIGEDRISEIIKEITGNNEDAFQEAWLMILSDHCETEDDIRRYARESYKTQRIHKFAELSIQKPIKIKTSDDVESLTLEGRLIDVEVDMSREQYVASSSGKINKQGFVHLDRDVFLAIKNRFPHDPLNHAIRKLVNLPPPSRRKLAWHKWEDELIKVRYPWGGSRSLTLDLNRSMNAINKRAQELKVKAGATLNSYKPVPEWMNIQEVVAKIGHTEQTITRYINQGYIEAIRIPNYHQGHDGVFVTPQALDRYLNRKEIIKEEIKERTKLVKERSEARRLISKSEKILNEAKKEREKSEKIRLAYLALKKSNISNAMQKLERKELVTATFGNCSHLVKLSEDGFLILRCKPSVRTLVSVYNDFNYDPFLEDVNPSCKVCKQILINNGSVK